MKHYWWPEGDEFISIQCCEDCHVERETLKDPDEDVCPGYKGYDCDPIWPVIPTDECIDAANPKCDVLSLFQRYLKRCGDKCICSGNMYSFLVNHRMREVYPRRGIDHYIEWTPLNDYGDKLMAVWLARGWIKPSLEKDPIYANQPQYEKADK